jgi:hypothetical protein
MKEIFEKEEQKNYDNSDKSKKSFVLVVDKHAPAHLGKRGEALQKSKLIEKIRTLRKSLR